MIGVSRGRLVVYGALVAALVAALLALDLWHWQAAGDQPAAVTESARVAIVEVPPLAISRELAAPAPAAGRDLFRRGAVQPVRPIRAWSRASLRCAGSRPCAFWA